VGKIAINSQMPARRLHLLWPQRVGKAVQFLHLLPERKPDELPFCV
jgi:hypothetical protein